jgi:hypothetical protein
MTRFNFFGTAAIVSALSASPAMAQHMIEEPGMFAFFHPNGDLGIASTKSPADAMASVAGNGGLARMRMQIRPHSLRDKRGRSIVAGSDR